MKGQQMAARLMNVHIRQEHIDLAKHGSADRCPLALALLEKEHTEWVVSEEYCSPLLKRDERWGHTPESVKLLDDWDSHNGGNPENVVPQTVKLVKLPPKKKLPKQATKKDMELVNA
jgi:hypothetical protein